MSEVRGHANGACNKRIEERPHGCLPVTCTYRGKEQEPSPWPDSNEMPEHEPLALSDMWLTGHHFVEQLAGV